PALGALARAGATPCLRAYPKSHRRRWRPSIGGIAVRPERGRTVLGRQPHFGGGRRSVQERRAVERHRQPTNVDRGMNRCPDRGEGGFRARRSTSRSIVATAQNFRLDPPGARATMGLPRISREIVMSRRRLSVLCAAAAILLPTTALAC